MTRTEQERRVGGKRSGRAEGRGAYMYTDGNTVRKIQHAPARKPENRTSSGRKSAGKRARAARMNMRYVLFLTAAAVVTVLMCVNYLGLQVESIRLRQEVTSLEVQLDAAILENNDDYDRIMTGIDLEHVKDVAMNELGMNYAGKGQIVIYDGNESDYVRQYQEVPEE